MSSVGSFFSYVNDARSHEPEVYSAAFDSTITEQARHAYRPSFDASWEIAWEYCKYWCRSWGVFWSKGTLQGTKMRSLANFLLQRISLSAVSLLKQALFVHKSMVLVFAVVCHDYARHAARQIQTLICCASAKEVLVCEKGRCNFCDKQCHPLFGVVLELILCIGVVRGANLRWGVQAWILLAEGFCGFPKSNVG